MYIFWYIQVISILSHIAKKLQPRQFLQNCLSEKAPSSKKFFLSKFMDKIVRIFLLKLTKIIFTHIPGCYKKFSKY